MLNLAQVLTQTEILLDSDMLGTIIASYFFISRSLFFFIFSLQIYHGKYFIAYADAFNAEETLVSNLTYIILVSYPILKYLFN